ncbi:unnamed protein product [Blepharisma stoltei]|uniref:Uncharacterized protein n=1 Tax=Blepharisma stoltei TaxID=1481888 RepID=A0AAU9JAM4_9CILI|nr:unnamed protein product [Blepharisma stoltei]
MDFDNRDNIWEELLQHKADLVQSFNKSNCCKICLCLELLKFSVCQEGCYPQGVEDSLLISRLLDGILDRNSISRISESLQTHFSNISSTISSQAKLEELESSLKKCSEEFHAISVLDLPSQLDKIKKNLANSENIPPISLECTQKLEELEKRLAQYEESLNNLTRENAELKSKIQRATTLYETWMKRRKNEIVSEYMQIRDEQDRLRNYLHGVKEQIEKNSESIEKLKRECIRPETKTQLEEIIKEYQNYKDIWNQQKISFDTSMSSIKKLSNGAQESLKDLDQTWKEIQFIKARQDNLKKWQKECKEISKHSDNLLVAADSVFSSQQEFKDFQQNILEKLDNLRSEVEAMKGQREIYRPNYYERNVDEDYFHNGSLIGNSWTCCKRDQYSQGCQKRQR